MSYCVILVTVPDQELGRKIAETLVAERLAACVNQIPGMVSTYRWQGKIERAPEELLVIKTRETLVQRVCARVRELHSYKVPEIVALPIESGSSDYLEWIEKETLS